MTLIAIVQSNYIPWKGYFDLINMVDHFVLYDDVQFNRYNWRNRNLIKTAGGVQWLTIPVHQKTLHQKIQESRIAGSNWNRKHWRAICVNYTRAEYFSYYREYFEDLYLSTHETLLSRVNYRFLKAACELLDIRTPLSFSGDYALPSGKMERVVTLCQRLGATEFLSGPTARPYLDEPLFTSAGIRVRWMDYHGYREYHQLHCPPFIHQVSIIDLILNEGPRAKSYLLSGDSGQKVIHRRETDTHEHK
jgi:hypothetical protein